MQTAAVQIFEEGLRGFVNWTFRPVINVYDIQDFHI